MDIVEVRIEATDHRLADQSVRLLIGAVHSAGARIRGPVPLPVKRRRKNGQTLFSRLIELLDVPQDAIASLRDTSLPAGVEAKMKTISVAGLPECVFRAMPGHDSGASRAGIPGHAGPPFRGMPGRLR